jgi:hypothetical protein
MRPAKSRTRDAAEHSNSEAFKALPARLRSASRTSAVLGETSSNSTPAFFLPRHYARPCARRHLLAGSADRVSTESERGK